MKKWIEDLLADFEDPGAEPLTELTRQVEDARERDRLDWLCRTAPVKKVRLGNAK